MIVQYLGPFFLSWFYWDPPREAFHVPYFGNGVAWYGIFFALAFLSVYFLVKKMFIHRLLANGDWQIQNVRDWKKLIQLLKPSNDGSSENEISRVYSRLSSEAQRRIKSQLEPDVSLKKSLVDTFNCLLKDDDFFKGVEGCAWDSREKIKTVKNRRAHIEGLFPKTFVSVEETAAALTDKITVYVAIGTVVGARVCDVLFYGFSYYLQHPLDIFKIWEGGLASHGGAVGILIAIILYTKNIKKVFPFFTPMAITDMVAIIAALSGAFIRIGNFFNQEILGKETRVPWAVVFGHPWNGESIVPRHPVQLYEAFYYFAAFAFMWMLWKKRGVNVREGFYTGWLFVLVFSFRFAIEWLKLPQTTGASPDAFLSTGQLLSIPFILAGLFLLLRKNPSADNGAVNDISAHSS